MQQWYEVQRFYVPWNGWYVIPGPHKKYFSLERARRRLERFQKHTPGFQTRIVKMKLTTTWQVVEEIDHAP